jgi:hypothetical protein
MMLLSWPCAVAFRTSGWAEASSAMAKPLS